MSRGVQVAGAAWRAATRTVAGVGDLEQGIGDGLHRAHEDEERGFLGRASKPRSIVCEWFGLKTTWMVFAGLASKPVVMVFVGLASKPVVTVSGGLASKLAAMVFTGLASKPMVMVFNGLASKPVATVSSGLASKPTSTIFSSLASKPVVDFLVEPQNQGGGGFPCLGLKTGSFGLVISASKSPRWFLGLGLKTNWASVCRLRHKTDGGRSARDTR
jgi:hypothetical protein